MQEPLITLEAAHHPDVAQALDRDDAIVTASLKINGELGLERDLNNGDRLVITVADADGEVLTRAYAEVGPPTFRNLKVPKVGIVGVNRAHKATIVED